MKKETPQAGYYRSPTLYKDKVVFVADDDLWTVPLEGGKAERLTAGVGDVANPLFSPDGKWIALTGTYEGHGEVYLIPSQGGVAERLTYISEGAMVVGWKSPTEIIFASTKGDGFSLKSLYTLDIKTGRITKIPCGPANAISFNPKGPGCVIQRHGYGYVSPKRYRGGTAGELWIDEQGKGIFKKLLTIEGNALQPQWIDKRIYFVNDHEGHGNIYSCTLEGKDLKRHTAHEDFFVRGLSGQGNPFVYTAGGDLYTWALGDKTSRKIPVQFHSSFTQRARKFTDPSAYLTSYDLDQKGGRLAIITRGRPFAFANWEGAVTQFGEKNGIRYKDAIWFPDGKRLLTISTGLKDDKIEIYSTLSSKPPQLLKTTDIGVVLALKISPKRDEIAFVNHRGELIHVNLKTHKKHVIDQNDFGDIEGFDWSPDGNWIVYDCGIDRRRRAIKLCHSKTFKIHTLTDPVLEDFGPTFDPEGKYIYFLSKRTYTPYPDNLEFGMSFPKGTKPYLILLQDTLLSPFLPLPKEDAEPPTKEEKKENKKKDALEVKIDLKGIERRILEFPVAEGKYWFIQGIPGKALYLMSAPESGAEAEKNEGGPQAKIQSYDFTTQVEDTLVPQASSFTLSGNKQWLCYYGAKKLRVIKAGEKPQDNDPSYRKGGWIDLNRIKLEIEPFKEWVQIFDQAWRLQKDFFWTADMSKVDWDEVYKRYRPLVDRLGTRGELSDLIGEMQGELGTLHAYVMGGDMRRPPVYMQGELVADFTYDKAQKGYKISNIGKGDPWIPSQTSPLMTPGCGVQEGDILCAINGQKVTETLSPEKLLVNQAGTVVALRLKGPKKPEKTICVKTLPSQTHVRYRDWVEKNRAYVHQKTKGKVGYIHIPDMSLKGFSEFHRGFLAEVDREGLVVDVRFNGGGNVSPLLLEKLSRKRLGYDLSRWWGPIPYPAEAPMGPMVALTNEYAGSDGDIFSQNFKTLGLGPLIGKRTWGGVIGIAMRHSLVDGGRTSQPEFSWWFFDRGWGIENYGVDPDIEVEITPQDYENGIDPQLDRGIAEVLKIIKTTKAPKLFSHERPHLTPPKLKK